MGSGIRVGRHFAAALFVVGLFAGASSAAMIGTLHLAASSDANITGTTINSSSPANFGLVINIFSNTRPVIEFPTSALPAGATVDGLVFNFQETSFANAPCIVNVNGFADNGSISASDATAAATQIGSYGAVALKLGVHAIALDPSVLQSAAGSHAFLALRLDSGSDATNTQIGSIEDAGAFAAPSLDVTYHVPEPSGLAALAACAILGRRRRQIRFAKITSRTR